MNDQPIAAAPDVSGTLAATTATVTPVAAAPNPLANIPFIPGESAPDFSRPVHDFRDAGDPLEKIHPDPHHWTRWKERNDYQELCHGRD